MKLLIYHCRHQNYIYILKSEQVVIKLFDLLSKDLDVSSTEYISDMDNMLELNGISYEIWDLNKCKESSGYYIPEHEIVVHYNQ
jgi:hypothetical protein